MIVTTIIHLGDAIATAEDVREILGDTVAVGIYYGDDSIPSVRITCTDAVHGQRIQFLPPNHKLVTTDGGATFRVEEVVTNPAHCIAKLERAVDTWRQRWLEESQEADRLGRRADDLETENRDLSARLRAVSLLKVWRDSLGRGFVFSDELGHAVSPEHFPEPKPVRIETEGAQV